MNEGKLKCVVNVCRVEDLENKMKSFALPE